MSELLEALNRSDNARVSEILAGNPELDIFEAAALGRMARLRELIAEDPSSVNAVGDHGFHPLGLAAYYGHVDAVQLLLEQGADPNKLSSNEHIQAGALHSALAGEKADEKRYEISQLLLESGADPYLADASGQTALDKAKEQGDSRLETLLFGVGETE
jgi:uncharacterized protein